MTTVKMSYDKNTALRIKAFLLSKGLTLEGTYGMMANLYTESGFRSNNAQNSCLTKLGMTDETYTAKVDNGEYTNFVFDRVGYGICQWTSSGRKQNLFNYAKSCRKSIGDENMQLNFLMQELSTSYKSVLKVLTTSHDISECTKYVMTKFERPANQSEENKNKRANYGIQLFSELETKYNNQTLQEENKMGYKVAIDAGHGSNTAGKRTPDGWREHYTNVKCAYFFDIALKRCGIDTIKIAWNDTNSKDDIDVALSKRQSQIKNAKCNISVSWHANAFGDGKSYNSGQGIETLIHNNSVKVKDSGSLAIKVQNYLIKGTKQKNRGVKSANLAMCNCVAMGTQASILIEIGFMTNKYEAELIQSDAFCLECAEEAAQGVCEYLGVTYVKPNGQSISSPSVNTTTNSTTTSTYTVVKGDTLSKIGQKTGVAWKTIADLNGIKSPYTIKVGQVLKLTNSTNSTASSSSGTSTVSAKKYVYNGIDYSHVFVPTYYSSKYADLKKVYGTNATALFDHFIKFGMQEKRQASASFNVEVYKNNYVDLQKTFGNNYPEYYKHYCQFGKKEGRKAV